MTPGSVERAQERPKKPEDCPKSHQECPKSVEEPTGRVRKTSRYGNKDVGGEVLEGNEAAGLHRHFTYFSEQLLSKNDIRCT